jgi:hypothetical protein
MPQVYGDDGRASLGASAQLRFRRRGGNHASETFKTVKQKLFYKIFKQNSFTKIT